MKSITFLANLQIVLGIALAVVCVKLDPGDYRVQEREIGKNLVEYSKAVESHRKLAQKTAESVYKRIVILENSAKICKWIKTISNVSFVTPIPGLRQISNTAENTARDLDDWAKTLRKHEKEFPNTIEALKNTEKNLYNIGTLLEKDSPIEKICRLVRIIGFMVAFFMVANGIAFKTVLKQE